MASHENLSGIIRHTTGENKLFLLASHERQTFWVITCRIIMVRFSLGIVHSRLMLKLQKHPVSKVTSTSSTLEKEMHSRLRDSCCSSYVKIAFIVGSHGSKEGGKDDAHVDCEHTCSRGYIKIVFTLRKRGDPGATAFCRPCRHLYDEAVASSMAFRTSEIGCYINKGSTFLLNHRL